MFLVALFRIPQKQIKLANDFLATEMGLMVNRASRDKIPITLTKDEIQMYIKRFQVIDKDNKGYVSINDIRRSLKVSFIQPRFFVSFILCLSVWDNLFDRITII